MKVNVIPSATKDTLRVARFKKNIDGKLEFRILNNYPMQIEIFYFEKSLGQYFTENINNVILTFFEKMAKFNYGTPDGVKEKLDSLEKSYLFTKEYYEEQLSKIEYFQNKEFLKEELERNQLLYPNEYTNTDVKIIIGLQEKQNIIRTTCDKYNMRMKDLSIVTGINENTLRTQASKNKVNIQIETAIKLYIENIELKKELEKYK